VCRFHEAERRYKGVDVYVSVMSHFARAHPELAARAVFVICGKASDADIAFARGCGLQVAANVTDDEMIDLFAAADIYMNLSRWEGYNLGIAQALAMGPAGDRVRHPGASTSREVFRLVQRAACHRREADGADRRGAERRAAGESEGQGRELGAAAVPVCGGDFGFMWVTSDGKPSDCTD